MQRENLQVLGMREDGWKRTEDVIVGNARIMSSGRDTREREVAISLRGEANISVLKGDLISARDKLKTSS